MPGLEISSIRHETEGDAIHASPTGLKTEENTSLISGCQGDLTSNCSIEDFTIGTGRTIFAGALLPAILSARYEIVLATCFWAPGPTLEGLSFALKELSRRIVAEGTTHRVRVYICLSSRSLFQKLFHTASKSGHVYPPDSWTKALGLPAAEQLSGLHLTVKSLFFKPFSVLHPKYLIVDRKDVWVPSCNVSWEEWYECSIHLRGQIVHQVHAFWQETWHLQDDDEGLIELITPSPARPALEDTTSSLHPFRQISFPGRTILPTTLLPHPHNASALHSLWFMPTRLVPAPATPLNTTLLQLFEHAEHSITLLTPNFTSPPVYDALLAALGRGVNVHLITNRRMMILEQLLTSGSITEWWIWKLKRAYNQKLREKAIPSANDLEAGHLHLGSLRIDIFRPPTGSHAYQGSTQDSPGLAASATKSHIKLTMIDENVMVLGSGNMDRASWYTSQELGVMLEGSEVVKHVWKTVETGLEGCLEKYV